MNGYELTERHSQKASGGVILLSSVRTQIRLILPEVAVSDQGEPVDLLDPGIELESPALQVDSLPNGLSGKTIALTIWTFVNKVISLLFNELSGFVIAFLPRS